MKPFRFVPWAAIAVLIATTIAVRAESYGRYGGYGDCHSGAHYNHPQGRVREIHITPLPNGGRIIRYRYEGRSGHGRVSTQTRAWSARGRR